MRNPTPAGRVGLMRASRSHSCSRRRAHAVPAPHPDHQVEDVLKHDSAQPLIDGENVGPLIELDFWAQKKLNLQVRAAEWRRVAATAA